MPSKWASLGGQFFDPLRDSSLTHGPADERRPPSLAGTRRQTSARAADHFAELEILPVSILSAKGSYELQERQSDAFQRRRYTSISIRNAEQPRNELDRHLTAEAFQLHEQDSRRVLQAALQRSFIFGVISESRSSSTTSFLSSLTVHRQRSGDQ
jgi:hypothetical protein